VHISIILIMASGIYGSSVIVPLLHNLVTYMLLQNFKNKERKLGYKMNSKVLRTKNLSSMIGHHQGETAYLLFKQKLSLSWNCRIREQI